MSSKRQITYGNATHELLFQTKNWDWANITGVTVTITDESATELLAAAACTLWDAVIEAGEDYAEGDYPLEIDVTDTDSVDPREDGLYRIVSDGGIVEDVTCESWEDKDTNDFTINLTSELTKAHTAADPVYGCYAVYSLDASDTDVFTKGRRLVVTWTPDGSDDAAAAVLMTVGSTEYAPPDTSSGQCPSDDAIYQDFVSDMQAIGISVDRVKEEYRGSLSRGARLFARREKLSYGGDSQEHEYNVVRKLYQEWLTLAQTSLEIWQDTDQDGVRETGEDAPPITWGTSERGPI